MSRPAREKRIRRGRRRITRGGALARRTRTAAEHVPGEVGSRCRRCWPGAGRGCGRVGRVGRRGRAEGKGARKPGRGRDDLAPEPNSRPGAWCRAGGRVRERGGCGGVNLVGAQSSRVALSAGRRIVARAQPACALRTRSTQRFDFSCSSPGICSNARTCQSTPPAQSCCILCRARGAHPPPHMDRSSHSGTSQGRSSPPAPPDAESVSLDSHEICCDLMVCARRSRLPQGRISFRHEVRERSPRYRQDLRHGAAMSNDGEKEAAENTPRPKHVGRAGQNFCGGGFGCTFVLVAREIVPRSRRRPPGVGVRPAKDFTGGGVRIVRRGGSMKPGCSDLKMPGLHHRCRTRVLRLALRNPWGRRRASASAFLAVLRSSTLEDLHAHVLRETAMHLLLVLRARPAGRRSRRRIVINTLPLDSRRNAKHTPTAVEITTFLMRYYYLPFTRRPRLACSDAATEEWWRAPLSRE